MITKSGLPFRIQLSGAKYYPTRDGGKCIPFIFRPKSPTFWLGVASMSSWFNGTCNISSEIHILVLPLRTEVLPRIYILFGMKVLSDILPLKLPKSPLLEKENRAIKRRLLISPKSINVYYNIPSSLNSVEGTKNNSIHETHKNILRKEPSLKKYINELQAKISHCRQISFYTDGSLTNKKEQDHQLVPGESRMGIGIVISPEGHDEGILDFSARVTGSASSTRAELWAILMVLEITPPNKKIKIYTDSASAIAAIKRFMTDRWGKKTKDLKNPNVLQAISDKCNGKQIIFELNKVEAHSGVFLNERADNLAKIGAKGNLLVEINPESLQRKVNYEWKSQSFDTDIKEFAKREQQINWYVNWRTQYRVLIHGTKISSRVTSNEDRDNRTFNIKILNDELPVLQNLHLRKPEIYKSDLCIICKQKKKDTFHPFECKDYNAIIRRKVIQHLAILGINHESSKTKKDIVTTFQKERFLKIDEGRQIRGTIESDHFSFIDMIRGLTYKYMKNKIKTAIISDSEKVNKIQEQLFNFLRNVMKLKWAERCNVILKWEKENEISEIDKKEKSKQKKANNNIVNSHYKTIKETLIKGASSIKDTIISESYRVATPFINKFFNIDNSGVVTY
ncbi:hypothetical protein Glove_253g60 [Diversispora epigaea]|uniref:ribonuclease H n=1 Tax=Diversispora epigaea TaxID=1348612 RepID=A0A397IDB5_9GLOM|nr:hypothetical protein Glove_253g60 [Diversispora epigaea]